MTACVRLISTIFANRAGEDALYRRHSPLRVGSFRHKKCASPELQEQSVTGKKVNNTFADQTGSDCRYLRSTQVRGVSEKTISKCRQKITYLIR